MKHKDHFSPMTPGWRIVVYLIAAIGGVLGFLGAKWIRPEAEFDLVLSLIFAFVAAGLAGGAAVVFWFICRSFGGSSPEDDAKDEAE